MAALTLNKRELEALDEVLDYFAYDEEKHYDGTPQHIYRALYILAKKRDLGVMSPEAIDQEIG